MTTSNFPRIDFGIFADDIVITNVNNTINTFATKDGTVKFNYKSDTIDFEKHVSRYVLLAASVTRNEGFYSESELVMFGKLISLQHKTLTISFHGLIGVFVLSDQQLNDLCGGGGGGGGSGSGGNSDNNNVNANTTVVPDNWYIYVK
jgi:hypothetical protein